MFKEILNSLFENIHELGHGETEIDKMMDAVAGMGHRIKWGHDLEGMINALDMEGVPGVIDWLQHMMLDFTSADGIPLPFAEAIRAVSGMEMDEAIDWLCINAADVAEMGIEGGLLAFFRENKKAFNIAVIAGTALGIVDDNPLLLAMNAVIILNKMRKEGLALPHFSSTSAILNKGFKFFSNVAIGTAALDIALGAAGIDLAGAVNGVSYPDGLDAIADGAGAVGDIIDGVATLGLEIAASRAVKWLFENVAMDIHQRIIKKSAILAAACSIKKYSQSGVPSSQWSHLLYTLEGTKYFPAQLEE